ncbi:DUF3784 domain-containing protein [Candidatus Stoquefichus massiliensis]|uniref:DUF3784 domain-containing protein n=1 Tax=Candidatus Stoquefichus massiliensis TaxID=1470350 RepID=UPI000480C37F|nr:DUF3784 domain-containing protein [Candidatus Stoquefichus massiliensis]
MLIIITLIFAVISIIFLLGKGSFLIAGYNTANKEEKQKYDEKKLCRVMGIGFSVVTLGLLAALLLKKDGTILMMSCMFAGTIIMLYGTRFCYSNNTQYQHNKPWYKKKEMLSTLLGIVVMVVIGVAMFTGNVYVTFEDDYLKVSASMTKSMEIDYQDIDSVDYITNLDTGSRTFGIGNAVIGAGRFKNEKFGSYHLYAYENCDDYIVIYLNSEVVVFNAKTKEETQKIYQEIQYKIK